MSIWAFDDQGQPLDDIALVAQIAAFRKALRDMSMPGGVGVVAGEGRRLEFTRGDSGTVNAALRELLAEAGDRGLPIGNASVGGGSIAVEFP